MGDLRAGEEIEKVTGVQREESEWVTWRQGECSKRTMSGTEKLQYLNKHQFTM